MATSYEDPAYLEQVYAALLTLLRTATFPAGITLKLTERMVDAPDAIAVADQPALVLVQGPMHVEQKDAFSLAKWTLSAVAVIYVRADSTVRNQNPLPITTANYLLWGIKNCFNTLPPYQKQTLGGLVVHAWIEGDMTPEVTSEQVVVTVPILMLAGPVE